MPEVENRKCQVKHLSILYWRTFINNPMNDSSDHEFLLRKLKFTVCLNQYKSWSVLNEMLSRQDFPQKKKQCKNYLISMVPCYIF